MRLHVHGQGRRDNQRTLFIANHPTYIDFLAFLSVCPQVGCVVKADLTQNRVLSYLIESAGYIASSNDASLIDSCTERLFNGESLIVFPEGTRSEGTQLRKFQRGAASIALRCDCDVVPVFYTCVPVTLQKKHSWFEVPEQAFELTLRFGEALDWQQTVPPEFAEAAARRHLTEYFEGVFGQELSHERAAA